MDMQSRGEGKVQLSSPRKMKSVGAIAGRELHIFHSPKTEIERATLLSHLPSIFVLNFPFQLNGGVTWQW